MAVALKPQRRGGTEAAKKGGTEAAKKKRIEAAKKKVGIQTAKKPYNRVASKAETMSWGRDAGRKKIEKRKLRKAQEIKASVEKKAIAATQIPWRQE